MLKDTVSFGGSALPAAIESASAKPTGTVRVEGVSESPPPVRVKAPADLRPVDQVAAEPDFRALDRADGPEVRQFLSDHRAMAPTSLDVVGGDVVIRIDRHYIRASVADIAGNVAMGGVAADSVLGCALAVFQHASQSNLPDTAIRSILANYKGDIAGNLAPRQAMERAFANVSMACLVESYVQNKDGLATDIRRTASFANDAFESSFVNRHVRTTEINTKQRLLDSALNDFTQAFNDARMTGDYSGAFDTLQDFFRKAATVAETPHWRMRATDPAFACPPLPLRAVALRGGNILEAMAARPAAEARSLVAEWVVGRSRFKTAFQAIGSVFAGAWHGMFGGGGRVTTEAAQGLVGAGAARGLVRAHGSTAAQGLLANASTAPKTANHAAVHQLFGELADSMIKGAAEGGYERTLNRLTTLVQEFDHFPPNVLISLIGEPPTRAGVSRVADILQVARARDALSYGVNRKFFEACINAPTAEVILTLDRLAKVTGKVDSVVSRNVV